MRFTSGTNIIFISIALTTFTLSYSKIVSINENWVCRVKMSCHECLRLEHCAWCSKENKCFAPTLDEEFCSNDTMIYFDHGLSIDGNAHCTCSNGTLENNCRPPGAADGPECSGRGSCQCGRCVCDPNPDPEHPSKVILGEFCEFDNFSCDGPDCGEGPYPLSPPDNNDF